jgi:hypothetical protein
MHGGLPLPNDGTREEIIVYHYLVHRQRRELTKMQQQLDERQRRAEESSRQIDERRWRADQSSERRANLSSTGGVSAAPGARQNRAGSRLNRVPSGDRDNMIRDLDLSFMTVDSKGKHGTQNSRSSPSHSTDLHVGHATSS